jgi:hypothetical protein
MTTSVRVIAHNFPAVVSVRSRSFVKGPANVTETVTTTDTLLQDGQCQEFTVTDTQSVLVEELEHEAPEIVH